MPGVPFTWVSIAVVTVCSTVWASAPVKLPAIFTVGGEISGYWATGNPIREINPTNTITIDTTMAVTGLRIKVSAIIFYAIQLFSAMLFFRSSCCYYCSLSQVLLPLHYNLLTFFQSIPDNDIRPDRLSQYQSSLGNLIAVPNHIHIEFSQLLGDCLIRNDDRFSFIVVQYAYRSAH